MKLEWIKPPKIIKRIFSNYYWNIPSGDNSVYLTFDDGPIPEVTPWVLAELEKYNAKATFFCIGENIEKHPDVFRQVLEAGHSVGNHTFHHLNGWNTSIRKYLEDTKKCQEIVFKHYEILNPTLRRTQCDATPNPEPCQAELVEAPNLFRPPYGKIRPRQSVLLRKQGYKIIMWSVLSADYDVTLSKEKCLENVIKNVQSGSIVVFHDSLKAFPRLEYVLPRVLEYLKEKGFKFKNI